MSQASACGRDSIGAMAEPRTRSIMAVGLAGGIVSGLLGVGGGIVMVPGLVMVASLGQRRAHGTSLAAIIPIGIVGAAVYAVTEGAVDAWLALVVAGGAVVGAPLGVRALSRVPEGGLRVLFALLMLGLGIRLLVGR
jgi:uncharacterized membrane protein YfcA